MSPDNRRLAWAAATGVFLGLTHATKETCAITFFSMAVGLFLTYAWSRWVPPGRGVEGAKPDLKPDLKRYIDAKALGWCIGVAFAVSFLLHSSFFTNMRGPVDSVLTQFIGLGRGFGGGIHDHPWHYYISMLVYTKLAPGPWWSEGLIVLLAVAGCIAALKRRKATADERRWTQIQGPALPAETSNLRSSAFICGCSRLVRFLAFYTLTMLVVYSVVPYKTPWCMLSFLHGMILLAGAGAVALVRAVPSLPAKVAAAVVIALCGYQLAGQARRANGRFSCDGRNPYAYAPTVTDLVRMAERIEEVARVSPEGHDMLVKVIAPSEDQWPLPWYLRRFRRVGYWTEPPADCDAPVVVVAPALRAAVESRLVNGTGSYAEPHIYGVRPTVHLFLYVRNDLWQELKRSWRKQGTGGAVRPAPGGVWRGEKKGASTVGDADEPDTARPVHRFAHGAMGTTFEVMVPGGDVDAAEAAGHAEAAFDELDRIEAKLSRFVESSDVSRISRCRGTQNLSSAAGHERDAMDGEDKYCVPRQRVRVGADAFDCLRLASRVNAETGGAFDVTVGALMSAWRYPNGAPRVPSEEDLARARALTGMHLLTFDREGHRGKGGKREGTSVPSVSSVADDERSVGLAADGVTVDLGGIGKGWALDRMADVLRGRGVTTALLHGGESSCLAMGPVEREGHRGRRGRRDTTSVPSVSSVAGSSGAHGDEWRLNLRDPADDSRTIGSLVLKAGRALSGSGQVLLGRHIIDPRTGRPVEDRHGTWAAAPTAALADALSTAFMVMSEREVEDYCREHPDVSAMLVPAGPDDPFPEEPGAAPARPRVAPGSAGRGTRRGIVRFGSREEFVLDKPLDKALDKTPDDESGDAS